MNFTLHIWRQKNQQSTGKFITYSVENIIGDDSFLEMLDGLNENLIKNGEEAIAFDYDCREGICGACGLVINGYPHGKQRLTTTCQLYMREYKNEPELWIEPFRAKSFPVVKDLIVSRNSLDEIIRSSGYISTNTGNAPKANQTLISKINSDEAFSFAECIGCGACVAVCPNASASLFAAAKITHLHNLPQGAIESKSRAKKMLDAMDKNGFGSCSNHTHCADVCPKGISLSGIKTMNKIAR
jgi:succinate dehydrogenase / fumarate reductase iron-sulfur subunit